VDIGADSLADSLVDSLVELEVGPVAHGGHCVARLDGRVVFVRHALPGEVVRARITEGGEGSRFLRADAVEILRASADRVAPRCAASGPGRCGGCDWQHASVAAQRELKAAVVREQLTRLAGLDWAVTVEALPGSDDGLGWRTRVQHGVDDQGRLGYRRHRSHEVFAVEDCPISHPGVAAVGHLGRRWPGASTVEVVVAPGSDQRLVIATPGPGVSGRIRLPDVDASVAVAAPDGAGGPLTRVRGRTWIAEQVTVGEWTGDFRITGSGFWQVHPAAAETLVRTVLEQLEPRAGEAALDLYSGVGLFAAALADRVGPAGAVSAVEAEDRAVADARRNLHQLEWVQLHRGSVRRTMAAALAGLPRGRADIVVLDPPRVGAGRDVVEALCAAGPRAISYVACDPAALARDIEIASRRGYALTALRAFDAFPMTHHVECVALLSPTSAGA
jgi:tRNA/tmRNA/rRNA uracil-C5-methylase (TrmA/RlmC/RlmD family)